MERINSLSLVFPVYNEEKNIERLILEAVKYCRDKGLDYEIICVDDGSTDKSAEVIEKFVSENPRVVLIKHKKNEGYGKALRTGFSAASKEFIFYSDSDLQFDLQEIDKLADNIEGVDFVAGIRVRRADSFIRRICGELWTVFTNIVLGCRVRDTDCAFKLFRKEVIKSLNLVSAGACVSAEIFYKAKKNGFKFKQEGISHFSRKQGIATGLKPKVYLRAFWEILRVRFGKQK